MIKKIKLQNYRSCLDTTFEIQPNLSVLIGPNGSGKTNILNAILLLRKLCREGDNYLLNEESPTAQSKLKVWFEVDGKIIILTADIMTFADENNNDIILSSRQQWVTKDITNNSKRITCPIWLIKHISKDGKYIKNVPMTRKQYMEIRNFNRNSIPQNVIKYLSIIYNFISGMRYYSASQFTNPSNCPVSFEIEKEGSRSRGLRLRGHSKFLFDLYSEYKINSLRYQQFNEIIGSSGIGLINNIIFSDIKTSSIDYSVKSGGRIKKIKRDKILIIPQIVIGSHELSLNQLSEGTFKTITLLFYLITDKSNILLLEEPEVCVHHGLLSSILELIKTYSKNKQIIISTHSDFVLDEVLPDNVYKITNKFKEGTKVYHIPKSMSNKELYALKKYLEIDGNLGEYWKHGALE